jgi:hypothetical protein
VVDVVCCGHVVCSAERPRAVEPSALALRKRPRCAERAWVRLPRVRVSP